MAFQERLILSLQCVLAPSKSLVMVTKALWGKGGLPMVNTSCCEHWERSQGMQWAGTLTLQGVSPLKYHMGAEAARALCVGKQAQTNGGRAQSVATHPSTT